MAELQIRFLGGFEVRGPDEAPIRFAYQKVAALLAYLASAPGKRFSRESLALLLWPDADEAVGRRNLRQALFELRRGLAGVVGDRVMAATRTELGFDPEGSYFSDLLEFTACLDRGLGQRGGDVDGRALARASDLYGGEFLKGFSVDGTEEYERWVLRERDRLSREALRVEGALVDHHRARGEYEVAVDHANRLLEIDPFSDSAHGDVMRLYQLMGEPNRAIAHYHDMAAFLERELEGEPGPELRGVYQAIFQGGSIEGDEKAGDVVATGPFLPLVGREEALVTLRGALLRLAAGRARTVVVTGQSGAGKTRLARTFLDQAGRRKGAVVLLGRWSSWETTGSSRGFDDVVHSGPLDAGRRQVDAGDPAELSRFLASLAGDGRDQRPVVVFLDDFQWADEASVELLAELRRTSAELPVLYLVAIDAGELRRKEKHPARSVLDDPEIVRLRLGLLDAAACGEIAAALALEPHRGELARFLVRYGRGRPLRIAELLNAMRDHGVLVRAGRDRWALEGDVEQSGFDPAGSIAQLVVGRVGWLAASVRRLVSLAAILGPRFDLSLLQSAAGEDMRIVEIAVEEMLRRSLVRHSSIRWRSEPPRYDIALWSEGERRGSFEFAHDRLWRAIYGSIPTARRQRLHLRAAEILASSQGRDDDTETLLAHHVQAAGR